MQHDPAHKLTDVPMQDKIEQDVDKSVSAQGERPAVAEAEAEKQTPPLDFPDGGLRAWMVLFGSWIATFVSFGYISSFGVFQNYYQFNQLRNESTSNIAWVGSLQLFFIFFTGLFTGAWFDAGHFSKLILLGSVLLIIAIFTTAECTELWQFILSQGFCGGLGCGFIFVPSIGVVAHWFRRKRALAYGITATGSSLGGVIYPILLSRMFERSGFKWAVRAAGFLSLALLFVQNLVMAPRLPPRKSRSFIELHHFRDSAFATFCVSAFLILLGLYFPIFFISVYAESQGVNSELAFYILSIMNAASVFGRLVPNLFADKIGPANVLYVGSGLAGILCYVWLAAKSTAGIIIFACFYGIASGAFVATIPAVVANITPDMTTIGMRSSLAFVMMACAALCGNPISGALYDRGGWVAPATFAGSVVLLGVGFGCWSRHITARRKGTWRV